MGAEIEIHNVIRLGSHGAMVIGYVQTGSVCVGQMTAALLLGETTQRLEVSAVERLSSLEARGKAVGIIFRHPPRLDHLRCALPAGSVLVLEDARTHRSPNR